MTDVTQLLIDTLAEFDLPVIKQGTMGEGDYPPEFFTFWNPNSNSESYYNNHPAYIWNFEVNFYSTDPENVYTKLQTAIDTLKQHGFFVSGRGYDAPSDEVTHTGRGVRVVYKEV